VVVLAFRQGRSRSAESTTIDRHAQTGKGRRFVPITDRLPTDSVHAVRGCDHRSARRGLIFADGKERVIVVPYKLMYRFGLAPWESRDVEETWRPILHSEPGLRPGRALDIGCGSGRDALYLANRGWRVTAVDFSQEALATARRRGTEEGAEVEWVQGDVGRLDRLGLEPGYTLIYDFGCIQGLGDASRHGAAAGLSRLAAPGALLLFFAFKAGRHIVLPRGMDQADILALLGRMWDLEHAQPMASDRMPAFARRAKPTVYRLRRQDGTPTV
jgi:SAM-dependent methyltransferase